MLHTLFVWVGRIAAITPECKSGGFTFDGSSPSLPYYVLCSLWTGTVETIGCFLCSLDESSEFEDSMRKTIE